MQFVNLTPHTINIIGAGSSIEPSGSVARISQSREIVGIVEDILITALKTGTIQGLPLPRPGVLFIVSALVRKEVPERSDVLSPGDLVRDEQGHVIGCQGLDCNPGFRA